MKDEIVKSDAPVVLVGGGDCDAGVLGAALREGLACVAADGGAERLLALKQMPDAVIGDMDSLDPALAAQLAPGVLHRVSEQDSTDFDKCLRNIAAPLVLGYGFLGARLDHQLAVLTGLASHPDRRCILIGAQDIAMLCPPEITLPLDAGTRVSLYPLAEVSGRSNGLKWAIDGLSMAPDQRVGTSNMATGPVTLQIKAPVMLLILPAECLPMLRAALGASGATWPARAR